MGERGESPLLPPNPAAYLTSWLFDIGPTVGGEIITYRDLVAWQQISGVELLPWEAQTIRRLSADYAGEAYHAKKPDRPAPYTGEREEIVSKRDLVAAKVRSAFSGLKRKPEKS